MLSAGDRYIIESINKRDRHAFEVLFRNYYADLCRFCANLIRNDVIAEDLVMDIFVKL